MTRASVVFVCVLCVVMILVPSPASSAQQRPSPPLLMGDHEDEERERNEEWFMRQRAYPFTTIPPDARRKAWEQVKGSAALAPGAWRARTPSGAKAAATVRTWRSIGPAPTDAAIGAISPVSGRVRALAVSPVDPSLVLLGGAGGGIWRSTNAGATYVPVSDDQVDLAVGAIRFAPSSPSTVYAAMGQEYLGSGVLKSTDAGLTWRRVSDDSLPTPGLANDLEIDPRDANRLYLAQYAGLADDGVLRSSGAYLSTDGGRTWRRTLSGLAKDVAIDADDPRTLYLTMSRVDEDGKPPGIYRSTDSGQTWAHVYLGPFREDGYPGINLTAGAGRVLAVAFGIVNLSYAVRVVASTDEGKTWTAVTGQGLPSSEASFLVGSPVDPLVAYVGYPGGDTFKTVDGGATWSCVTIGYCDGRFGRDDKTHVDMHALAFSPADQNRVYLGTDGGVYLTTDGAQSWTSLNESLSLVTFRTVAISPIDPLLSVGGTQDNGSQRRVEGGLGWREIITGDGGGVVFDPTMPSFYFTTYIYGSVFRWDAEGFDGEVADDDTFGESSSRPRIAFYPPFVGDGVSSRLYFGTWRLFLSDDRGESWSAPAGTLDLTKGSEDVLSAIGVGAANRDVIYTGSSEGRVMVSLDAGKTWRDATNGLPDRFVSSITVDRSDPNVAWLTVSGFRSGHVFMTRDAGRTWTDVTGPLPDIPANALLQDPLDPNVLYLGTDIGVFRSPTGGQAWESFSDGMPPALALSFGSHPSGIVQVATYGRGAYELGDGGSTPNFALTLSPASVEIARGTKVSVAGSVLRANGFGERVTLSAPNTSALKLKVKVTQPSSSGNFTVTVKAKRPAAPGTYPVAVTGRSASGILRTGTLSVTVR